MVGRKERVRLEREELILKVSTKLLLEHGYYGFTMDHIASETEYSKGTIYQHFSSKEAILAALYLVPLKRLQHIFKQVVQFDCCTRQRAQLLHHAYVVIVDKFSYDFVILAQILSTPFREKAPKDVLIEIESTEDSVFEIVLDLIQEAKAKDNIQCNTIPPEELAYGMWALSFGGFSLMKLACPIHKLTQNPMASLNRCVDALLDGVGWQASNENTTQRDHFKSKLLDIINECYTQGV